MLGLRPRFGALAQLVERFHGMEEARGSNPLSSTQPRTLVGSAAPGPCICSGQGGGPNPLTGVVRCSSSVYNVVPLGPHSG